MISVIVPVYKAEKYIKRCIDSICNQTYKNIEIILVDDGSPDNCPFICEQYAEKDNRIKVIHKENGGAASARNCGLQIATGEYIGFVDSDDYIDKNMYENMLEKAVEYNSDIVMCDCIKEDVGNRLLFTHPVRGGFYNKRDMYSEYFEHLLMEKTVDYPPTISNCTLLIKRGIILDNSICYAEGIRFSEDLLFGSLVAYYAESLYYMRGEAYYHYIVNPISVTHTKYAAKWIMFMKLYKIIKEMFSSFKDYDFSDQIDMCLLFFVYHVTGELKQSGLPKKEYDMKKKEILQNNEVQEMFKRLSVRKLNIHWKLRIRTLLLKKGIII